MHLHSTHILSGLASPAVTMARCCIKTWTLGLTNMFINVAESIPSHNAHILIIEFTRYVVLL